jgi:hypothetical protein
MPPWTDCPRIHESVFKFCERVRVRVRVLRLAPTAVGVYFECSRTKEFDTYRPGTRAFLVGIPILGTLVEVAEIRVCGDDSRHGTVQQVSNKFSSKRRHHTFEEIFPEYEPDIKTEQSSSHHSYSCNNVDVTDLIHF